MEKYLQCDMFDFLNQQYKITKPIRLIELFGGIGSQAKALERLGADFTHYKLVEFDKYAVASYNAVHHTNFITQDITKINAKDLEIVDTDKYEYIMCYSFPCQDLSLAGKCKGMEKGSGTRSGLLWEVERLLNECEELPQCLILENVSQIHNEKNWDAFRSWQEFLQSKGYSNFWQDLNAKDYGIPQNRNRCFMVSILSDDEYSFPKPMELKLKLKDMLEDEVDEKYYLSQKLLDCFMSNGTSKYPRKKRFLANINRKNQDIGNAVTTLAGNRATDNFVVMPLKKDTDNYIEWYEKGHLDMDTRAWKEDKVSPTLHTNCGNTKILISENTKKGYAVAEDGDGVYINRPHQKRGVVQKGMIQTIKTGNNDIGVVVKDLRIRKLTPRECWRLMGFDDIDFDNASKVNSNAQLYKQAGNSIVVNVLEAIFKEFL